MEITKEFLDNIKVGEKLVCNNWPVNEPFIVIGVSENYILVHRIEDSEYAIIEKKKAEYDYNNFTKGSFRVGPCNLVMDYDITNVYEIQVLINNLENGEVKLSNIESVDLKTVTIID